jgi:mono/diheme cytochrome c family protein
MRQEMVHMVNRTCLVILGATVYLGVASGTLKAQTAGDAVRGAALAESWCQTCHIIDKKGTGQSVDPAPAFPLIASDPKKTPGYLQRWLSTSHPQMPNFNLGRREIVDLIAYIQTLKPAR